MKPKADRTMTKNTYSGSCEATDVHSVSDVLYWVPINPNMHEYEINDYFEEWYDDDMNEFRYGNRCAMMVYGQVARGQQGGLPPAGLLNPWFVAGVVAAAVAVPVLMHQNRVDRGKGS